MAQISNDTRAPVPTLIDQEILGIIIRDSSYLLSGLLLLRLLRSGDGGRGGGVSSYKKNTHSYMKYNIIA